MRPVPCSAPGRSVLRLRVQVLHPKRAHTGTVPVTYLLSDWQGGTTTGTVTLDAVAAAAGAATPIRAGAQGNWPSPGDRSRAPSGTHAGLRYSLDMRGKVCC